MKLVLKFFILVLITSSVYADDHRVPANFQAVLLSKIIALDTTLQDNDKETLKLAVFYDSSKRDSVRTKSDFINVFETLDMYGKPVDTFEVSELAEIKDYDLVYVADIDDSKLASLLEITVKNKILTIGVDEEYAHKGCALAFSVIDGRPKVLMNQDVVDAIEADFALQVMLIAEVI